MKTVVLCSLVVWAIASRASYGETAIEEVNSRAPVAWATLLTAYENLQVKARMRVSVGNASSEDQLRVSSDVSYQAKFSGQRKVGVRIDTAGSRGAPATVDECHAYYLGPSSAFNLERIGDRPWIVTYVGSERNRSEDRFRDDFVPLAFGLLRLFDCAIDQLFSARGFQIEKCETRGPIVRVFFSYRPIGNAVSTVRDGWVDLRKDQSWTVGAYRVRRVGENASKLDAPVEATIQQSTALGFPTPKSVTVKWWLDENEKSVRAIVRIDYEQFLLEKCRDSEFELTAFGVKTSADNLGLAELAAVVVEGRQDIQLGDIRQAERQQISVVLRNRTASPVKIVGADMYCGPVECFTTSTPLPLNIDASGTARYSFAYTRNVVGSFHSKHVIYTTSGAPLNVVLKGTCHAKKSAP